LSAFASAIESASVTAEITVEDVLHLKPAFTRSEAREFLRTNAEVIATEMLASAERVMFTLLKGGRDAN
jgi:hypothetical protein